MNKIFVKRPRPQWLLQLLVALSYAAIYLTLREVSFSHGSLTTGLRVGCLLLMPYRYWPALLVGETLPMAYFNALNGGQLGLSWIIFASIPPIGEAMPVVWALRRKLPKEGRVDAEHIGPLLLCAFAVSALISLVDAGVYESAVLVAGEQRISFGKTLALYFMGIYLGILMLVPLLLLTYQWLQRGWKAGLRAYFPRSKAALFEAVALVALDAALCLGGLASTDDFSLELMRVGLFIPVIWSAVRYGWEAATLAGACAGFGLVLLMPKESDPYTIAAQAMLALGMTTLLLLGSRTTALRKLLSESRRNLALTRQELYLAELRTRNNAKELDRVHAVLAQAHNRLLQHLGGAALGSVEEQECRARLNAAQARLYRLADSMSPREWQRNGQPNALWSGPIADVLEVELGVAYEAHTHRQLDLLSPDTNMVLYRLGCEAISYLLMHAPTDQITLRTMSGEREGWLWVELVIESVGETIEAPSRELLLSGLGSSGLGEVELRHRVQLYNGTLNIDALPQGKQRITMRICEVADWKQRSTQKNLHDRPYGVRTPDLLAS